MKNHLFILFILFFISNLAVANNHGLRLEGFLEIRTFFNPDISDQTFEIKPFNLYERPDANSRRRVRVMHPRAIEHQETADYHQVGALVYAISGDYYLLKTSSGTLGWYKQTEEDIFHAYLDLLATYRVYMNVLWDNRVYNQANGTQFREYPRVARNREIDTPALISHQYDARVLQSIEIGNQVWVEVEFIEDNSCGDESPTVVLDRGWVKLHDRSGAGTIWYPNRGC